MRSSYWTVLLAAACIALGYALAGDVHLSQAVAQPVGEGGAPRFQASAFAAASPEGVFHGCYVIDTTTGETWHVRAGGEPVKVADKLP
jgi:hypothetical protein